LTTKETLKKTSIFKIKLYEKIGEQQIDIIIAKDNTRPIAQEAIKKGVRL
jgi:hypothetical protein